MIKALIYIIAFLLSMMQSYAVTTITFESDYGVNNIILFLFIITLFAFWLWVYNKFTEPVEFNRNNLLSSVTNISIKFICFIWFFSLLYTFQAVMFISSGENFLTDKLDLLYGIFYLSLVVFGILGLFNSVKIYNKMSGTGEFFREFIWEIKSGGKK